MQIATSRHSPDKKLPKTIPEAAAAVLGSRSCYHHQRSTPRSRCRTRSTPPIKEQSIVPEADATHSPDRRPRSPEVAAEVAPKSLQHQLRIKPAAEERHRILGSLHLQRRIANLPTAARRNPNRREPEETANSADLKQTQN